MKKFIVSIDQGTTSSRAILFNLKGQSVYTSQTEFTQYFPKDGWVEHNPNEIWSTTLKVLKNVIKKSKKLKGKILTIGITNQRETTILWDKTTGKVVYNAIVWQDRRASDYCKKLIKQKKETIIKNGDLIRTNESGKIILTLLGGDNVFLAPDTEIKFKENKKKKGLSNIINRNLTLKGRLLAKIRKNLARPIQIRTPNAIVAVKGTEFVTEFIQQITNVGTIKGLVSMTSVVNNKSVELKEGTMSSVSKDGAVMPPSEFSGKLMQDFEFAGDKMSEEDAAGKKIKL